MNSKGRRWQFALLASFVMSAACVDMEHSEKGRIMGTATTVTVLSEPSGTPRDPLALGVMLGASIGGEQGGYLDDEDLVALANTALFVLDHGGDGHSKSWRNWDSGHSGTFTTHSTYRTQPGVECRRYTSLITISRQTYRSPGTACRQRDGTWSIVR